MCIAVTSQQAVFHRAGHHTCVAFQVSGCVLLCTGTLCWGKLCLQSSFTRTMSCNTRGFYDQKPQWCVCPLQSCVSSDIPRHLFWCSSCQFCLKPWESKQVSARFSVFPESLYLHLSIAKYSTYTLSNGYSIFLAFLLPS